MRSLWGELNGSVCTFLFFVKEKGIFKSKIGNGRHLMAVQGYSSSPHRHTSCSVEDPTRCSYVMLAKSQSWPQSSKHFCSVAGSTPVANYPQQIASICSGGMERRVVSTWHERGKSITGDCCTFELATYIILLMECAAGWLGWLALVSLLTSYWLFLYWHKSKHDRAVQAGSDVSRTAFFFRKRKMARHLLISIM